MKKVVSVSIGSSKRNHCVEAEFLGEKYIIQRIGTDGSITKAIDLIRALDGKIDAFGLGGIDLYLAGAHEKFMLKAAIPIVEAAQKTPIVDGTGLKNTLEKSVIEFLAKEEIIDFTNKKVLLVCAIDRYKMAESFINQGCETILGDLMFALGIPMPIKNIKNFKRIVTILLPVVTRLPYEILYPIGENQECQEISSDKYNGSKFDKYYHNADIIAGDFLYINKYLPENLNNKIIITNTVTKDDIIRLRQLGVKMLITSTPEFDGRSFGTNVIEAVLIAASGKNPQQLTMNDYIQLTEKMNLVPRIEYLNDTEHGKGTFCLPH